MLEACASSLAASVFLPAHAFDFPGVLGEVGCSPPEFALVERVLHAAIGEFEGLSVVPWPRNKWRDPLMGKAYVHTVIDDHSRLAYAEIHDDETALTATAVLVRAVEWFNARGVTVERVLSDNGGAYRSHLWRDTCAELGIRHKRTRPYRPQTNGKIERFHRTLADGWAYARCYTSETERRGELEGWLHYYNHHRPHTACGNQPHFSRLPHVPDR